MAAPHILARNLKDAHAFAREDLGLLRGQYRVVNSSSSISSTRGADLYLVPGWEKRYDRFSMKGAIRYTRLNVIDVAAKSELAERFADPDGTRLAAEQEIADDLEPAGMQGTIFLSEDEAMAFLTALESEPKVIPGLAELVNEPSVFEEKRTRRRRCSECGELVDPDKVEDHAAEHLPTGN